MVDLHSDSAAIAVANQIQPFFPLVVAIYDARSPKIPSELHSRSIAKMFTSRGSGDLENWSSVSSDASMPPTDLVGYLRANHISDVYLVGQMTAATLLRIATDAKRLGFRVWLVEDGWQCLDVSAIDRTKLNRELETVGATLVPSSRWLNHHRDEVDYAARIELASGKFLRLMRSGRWEYAQRHNATAVVVIVAITDDDEVVLIQQYREPLGRRCIELPAGLVGDVVGQENEPTIEAVRRELLEETGFEASDICFLAHSSTTGGLSSEIASIYLATGLKRISAGGGADGEMIQVHLVPRRGIEAWLSQRRREGLDIAMLLYGSLWLAASSLPPIAQQAD